MPLSYEPILFNKEEIVAITNGKWIQNEPEYLVVTGIFIAPELYNPQHVFIATGGFSVQKKKEYVIDTLRKGVIAAIIDEDIDNKPVWASILQVENTKTALEKLALYARNRSHAEIIAVTGSVGKTSIKETLSMVLSSQGTTFKSYKGVNGGVGLLNELALLPEHVDYGIFEIGMLGPNSILPRTNYIKPHIALINSIAPAHIAYHSGIESIIKTKTDIIQGLGENGSVVIPRDSEYYERIYTICSSYRDDNSHINIVSFGESLQSDSKLLSYAQAESGSHVTADILGEVIDYYIGILGKFWILNSIAVLTCVKLIGADIHGASKMFEFLQPGFRRGERFRVELEHGIIEIIDDTFNANPASMCSAIQLLSDIEKPQQGRKILVIGDMEELGKNEISYHCDLSSIIENSDIDLVCTVGEKMNHLFEKLPDRIKSIHTQDSTSMADKMTTLFRNGDLILVKGSNKTKMNVIVNKYIQNKRSSLRAPIGWSLKKELQTFA